MDIQSLIKTKNGLVLEARKLKASGQLESAVVVIRAAAQAEEDIGKLKREDGKDDWYINVLSAGSCWLQCGEAENAERCFAQVQEVRPDLDLTPWRVL